MRRRGAGSVISRPGTKRLYLRYYRNGKQEQKATGTSCREVAERLLQQRRLHARPSHHSTNDGLIYFIQGKLLRKIKIGFTRYISVESRLRSLQTACSEPLSVIGVLDGSYKKECSIHKRFKTCHFRGEWFEPAPKLMAFIASIGVREKRRIERLEAARIQKNQDIRDAMIKLGKCHR
jgi:hypothetical protein